MVISGAGKVWLSFWFQEITKIPGQKIKKLTHKFKATRFIENTSSYTENTT